MFTSHRISAFENVEYPFKKLGVAGGLYFGTPAIGNGQKL